MSERTGSAESNRGLLRDYFAVMATGGDLADFFTEDVTWVNVESGEQFRGRAAVRDYDSQLIVLGWLEDQNAAGVCLLIQDCGEFAQEKFARCDCFC